LDRGTAPGSSAFPFDKRTVFVYQALIESSWLFNPCVGLCGFPVTAAFDGRRVNYAGTMPANSFGASVPVDACVTASVGASTVGGATWPAGAGMAAASG